MKKLLIFCLAIGLYGNAYAQAQPQPKGKAPQDMQMPKYMPEDLPADIPNMDFLGSYGTDPQTGKPHYYMDSESGLYFDFKEKVVRDYKTGKEYTFEELKKLLREKKEKPRKLQKKRI